MSSEKISPRLLFSRKSVKALARGLALVASGAPLLTPVYLVLKVFQHLLPVTQVWLSKLLVDSLTTASNPSPLGLTPGQLAIVYALTIVIPSCLTPLGMALSAALESQAVATVDRRVMSAGDRMADLSKLERPKFHDELQIVQQATSYYAPRFLDWFVKLVTNLLSLVGIMFLLGGLHPLIPVGLLVVMVPHLFSSQRQHFLAFRAMAQQSRSAREMSYSADIATNPTTTKEVRVFGLGDFFLNRYRDRRDTALKEVTRVRLSSLRLTGVAAGFYGLAIAIGFWYVASRTKAGALTLGDLALYLNGMVAAQALSQAVSFGAGFVSRSVLGLRTLFDFLDSAQPGIRIQQNALTSPVRFENGIRIESVSFRYPEGSEDVFQDLSAFIPAGEVTALVGYNGAGKSTLVKLITRMYDPTRGTITLDGKSLWEYDLHNLREKIAVVYQDFARFSLTLGENISVGAVWNEYSDEELQERVKVAANNAGADLVAAKFESGYETPLTRWFEGGVELSGGEWQKVALARGFIRDSAFVILDEPTSALDAKAEHELFLQFRELMKGRTALLISHRFSTVKMADQILVLEHGKIIESGSHSELLRLGGRYASLFEMQAGRYR